MKKQFFYLAFLLLSNFAFAQNKNEQAIRAILKNQEASWNKADLRSFMIGYWESDQMLFLGKKGPTYGYTATLNNYLKSYPDTSHTGKFTSSILSVKKLSNRYYMVVGQWHLLRSAGDIGGYYSLLFHKIKRKWVIIMDHTS